MISAMLATVDPGDEVIIFEPFYENYGPDCILAGAVPRFVPLLPPEWNIDFDALESAFGPKTRAVILNTPNNPTGKVFDRVELSRIAELCQHWDALLFSDEIYEHMVYDGTEHISPATLPGMRERTVIINGLSKTFSVTGWRVGYTIAPPELSAAIRKVHDFLTVGAAAPLQAAGAVAMDFPDQYYLDLQSAYQRRRDVMVDILQETGFGVFVPKGAYYVMCDVTPLGFDSGLECTRTMVEDLGVAVVPGTSFFRPGEGGRELIRFAFPKRQETLNRARERLRGFDRVKIHAEDLA
jgi:aspartate/methionine/tyrosine aminotransferase